MVNVIESELVKLHAKATTDSVEQINENFLKENITNYVSAVESAKLIFDLNPASNQKRALDLITDLSKYSKQSLTLKNLIESVRLIEEKEYFGKQNESFLNDLKQKLKVLYPHANLFQTAEDLNDTLAATVANLSTSANLATASELSDKLVKTSLNADSSAGSKKN